MLVLDLTRYLPGAFATAELHRLGARVVRVEQPGGDPMRATAAGWHDALNAGKESIVCDLPGDAPFLRGLLGQADVVLDSFRPGVLARLGVRPQDLPAGAVACSITGFGEGGRHEQRAGHDLNYQGWAGVLHDTAPGWPAVQVADLAAGSLAAVNEILAALLVRERTGEGARLTISMTHGTHRLASFRLAGDPRPKLLTGGLACYRTYATADGRHLTVGALEPKFFVRLCELIGRPELADEQYADEQQPLVDELVRVFASKTLEDWLRVFDNDDVCVGPVATLEEAAADLRTPDLRTPEPGRAAALGEHTEAWRRELER
jgi:crotonobetainyl-CoA:carnitine CoA-transferase CaiB-like acyl-CoA transferase